jgi:hypothetical protein
MEATEACRLLITVDRVCRITQNCIVLQPIRPQPELNLIQSFTQRLIVAVFFAEMNYDVNKPSLTENEMCMLQSCFSLCLIVYLVTSFSGCCDANWKLPAPGFMAL